MSDMLEYSDKRAQDFRGVFGDLNIKQKIGTGDGKGITGYTIKKLASRARSWDRMHAPLKVADVLANPSLAAAYKQRADEIDEEKGISKDSNGKYFSEGEITEDEKDSKKKKTRDTEDDMEKAPQRKKQKQKAAPRKKWKEHPNPTSDDNNSDADERDEDSAPKKHTARLLPNLKKQNHTAPQSNDCDHLTKAEFASGAHSRQLEYKDVSETIVDGNKYARKVDNAPANSLLAKPNAGKREQAPAAANPKETIEEQKHKSGPGCFSESEPLLPQTMGPLKIQPAKQSKRGTKRKRSEPPRDETSDAPGDTDLSPPQMSETEIDHFIAEMRKNMPILIQSEEQAAAWRAHLAAGPQFRRKNQVGEFNSDALRKRLRVSTPPSSQSQRIIQGINNLFAVPGFRYDLGGLVDAHKRVADGKKLWSSRFLLNTGEGVLEPVELADWLTNETGLAQEDAGNFIQDSALLNEGDTPASLESAIFTERDDGDRVKSSKASGEEVRVDEDANELKGKALRREKHKKRARKTTACFRQKGRVKKDTAVDHQTSTEIDDLDDFWVYHYPEIMGPDWQED